jgi:hypothetical protein
MNLATESTGRTPKRILVAKKPTDEALRQGRNPKITAEKRTVNEAKRNYLL